MDICQIGYDVQLCEFDSLRGLGIDIIGRVHFDNRDRFALWMGSIGKATEPCQQTSGCWHLTFDSFLNLDMGRWEVIRKRNFYCFMYRQHIWLRKWEVIVGGHDWSCWDLWIWGGRGFVGVQRRSCIFIPWICYERSFSEFHLFIWNQLVFNQRLQSFVQPPEPYLLIFAWRN